MSNPPVSKPPGELGRVKSNAPDPLIGRTINDRFRITGLIARGGMGKVYRAEQSPLNRLCALKVLNPSYAGDVDPEFHKRFFLEASIASKLTHPNTVTIFDYGRTDDDIYYMAMEYLEGVTLHRAIRMAGHLPEDRTAHVTMQICRALREAHLLGVIHRDLKPANIFLVAHGDEPDFVKVLDFGLVKDVGEPKPGEDQLTQTGLFMGSPKYMAPEQIRGDRVDARTDIYSLGVMMYEMLSGKVPFDRPNSVNTLMAHVNELPPPLRTTNPNVLLSAAMEDVVMKCVEKDPDLRFKSMDELLAALKRVMGVGGSAFPPGATGNFQALSAMASGSYPGQPTGSVTPSPFRSVPPAPLITVTPPPGSRAELVPAVEAPRPRSRTALMLLVTGLAIGIGISAFAIGPRVAGKKPTENTAVAGANDVTPPTAAAPTDVSPVASTGAASSSAAPAAATAVHVKTEPEGAVVREDGKEVCAATPCEIAYRGDEAQATHHLVVSKAGFRSELRETKAGGDPLVVRLVRTPQTYVAPRPTDSTTPQGFKEIPY
ncbi:MAG: Serine/threonine protein kinase PrkC, regulator of stationary phase [Myxococcaceae bacterium]|jgi:serine/threonine protein kinase|nr:Serine/threonine protein kinase PrkC, regulator of stationary phase [Myxococcaceae bacterium]